MLLFWSVAVTPGQDDCIFPASPSPPPYKKNKKPKRKQTKKKTPNKNTHYGPVYSSWVRKRILRPDGNAWGGGGTKDFACTMLKLFTEHQRNTRQSATVVSADTARSHDRTEDGRLALPRLNGRFAQLSAGRWWHEAGTWLPMDLFLLGRTVQRFAAAVLRHISVPWKIVVDVPLKSFNFARLFRERFIHFR